MNTIESINLIYRNPKIRGGRPCIVGTGLRVTDVVMSMQYGERSPEQIAEDFQITLGQVYAALAYYYENKDEIDTDIREDIRIGRQLAEEGFGKPTNSIFPLSTANERALAQALLDEETAFVEMIDDSMRKKLQELMEEVDRPEN